MTQIFADTFTRADSTTIGSNWVETTGNWDVISNAVRESTLTGTAAYLINSTAPGTADYSIAADLTQGALISGNNRGMGLVARYADINNFYLAWINEFGTPVQLYAVNSGSYNLIGSWTPGATMSDPVAMRLECQGTTIRVFVNGTQRISVTDSSISAAGSFGLRVYSGASFTDQRTDNVLVNDFVAGGGVIAGRTPTTGTAASGAGFSISVPAGTAVNDLLVLVVGNANTTGPNAPTGWTKVNTYSAGTAQSVTIFTAPYSASLTLSFTNASSQAAWACNAYFQANSMIVLDGAPVAASNTTSNTTMATGAPVATGNVAGDYEVLAYAWSSNATLTAVGAMTKDSANIANGTTIGVALGHANSTLGANATGTAFAPTLSSANTRKTGVGILLLAVPLPSSLTDLSLNDGFDSGSLNTGKWTAYGTGQSMTAQSLSIAPPGTSGVYGGVISATSYDLTGRDCYVKFTQRLNATTGNVQSLILQLDSSNNLELTIVDTNLIARRLVAGSTTSTATVGLVAAMVWMLIEESSGVIYWLYSSDRTNWVLMGRCPNPFAVTALSVVLQAGCYQAVATPGTALYNYVDLPQPILPVTSVGVATATGAVQRARPLSGTAVGSSANSGVIAKAVMHNIGSVSAAGVATTSGAISRKIALTGASVGSTTVSATLSRKRGLSGLSNGVATVSQALSRYRALQGSSAGVATTAGLIRGASGNVQGTSVGRATTSGVLSAVRALTGVSAGLGLTSAVATRKRPLQGLSAGQASTLGLISKGGGLLPNAIDWSGLNFNYEGPQPDVLWNPTTKTFVLA